MREAKAVAETFQETVQYNSKTPEGTIPMLIKINADKAKQINELGKDSSLNYNIQSCTYNWGTIVMGQFSGNFARENTILMVI